MLSGQKIVQTGDGISKVPSRKKAQFKKYRFNRDRKTPQ
jgi:hypothetical protein